MIKFSYIISIAYVVIVIFSYLYLKKSYFPQNPSKFEKFIIMIMAIFWIISVPITFIFKNDDHEIEMSVSYDGFVGREQ